jgi:hypothetical protein
LAAELALRGGECQASDRAAYAARFPQFLDVVIDVFLRHHLGAVESTAILVERYFKLIRAFRASRRTDALTTTIRDGDRNLRALAEQLAHHAGRQPADVDAPPEQQLWLWLLHACGKLNIVDPGGLEVVVRELLNSFPSARQSILIDLLLGHVSSQAARANGVTQRTVTTTISIATKLLEAASGARLGNE